MGDTPVLALPTATQNFTVPPAGRGTCHRKARAAHQPRSHTCPWASKPTLCSSSSWTLCGSRSHRGRQVDFNPSRNLVTGAMRSLGHGSWLREELTHDLTRCDTEGPPGSLRRSHDKITLRHDGISKRDSTQKPPLPQWGQGQRRVRGSRGCPRPSGDRTPSVAREVNLTGGGQIQRRLQNGSVSISLVMCFPG